MDPDLLEILVCPDDHHPLTAEGEALRCPQCGRRYPVVDGIPVMLPNAADAPDGQP
ncbi:MAG TPA: Trm112 family protein [Armatimonadota bacterium]|nr:Trm112 family protein [Armatimonadota bacterium]HOS43317.1 Trm112 family protein [Armatimonadota bacterium]